MDNLLGIFSFVITLLWSFVQTGDRLTLNLNDWLLNNWWFLMKNLLHLFSILSWRNVSHGCSLHFNWSDDGGILFGIVVIMLNVGVKARPNLALNIGLRGVDDL